MGLHDSPTLYLLAYARHINSSKKMPEPAKNLAVPITKELLLAIESIPWTLELAYRRGMDNRGGKFCSYCGKLIEECICDKPEETGVPNSSQQ
jgi:hypothetical protein